MFGRRIVRICLEGVYYTLVLAFIVSGAVVRDINLLFALAGMMVGPLLINWRMVVRSVRRLHVERRLPQQIFAGRPFRVEIHAENRRRRTGSWMVVVEDVIHPETTGAGRARHARKSKVRVVLPFVGARQAGTATYRAMLPRRGRYRFGPLRVSTRFPLGLVKASTRIRRYERLLVFPHLGRLSRDWLQIVDTAQLGRHEMHCRRGPIDGDYYGLREWRPGDSRRWIHWRTTAKLGKLAVREFEQQRNRDMTLVVDLWQPDDPTDADRGRVELAVSFAATVVDELARRGASRLIVALAAERPGWWAATASGVFARQTLERLALVRAARDNRLAQVLAEVLPSVPFGAHIVVISTRPDATDELSASATFARIPRHQRMLNRVVWLDVSDPRVLSVFHWD